jgi:hypothetical protein
MQRNTPALSSVSTRFGHDGERDFHRSGREREGRRRSPLREAQCTVQGLSQSAARSSNDALAGHADLPAW